MPRVYSNVLNGSGLPYTSSTHGESSAWTATEAQLPPFRSSLVSRIQPAIPEQPCIGWSAGTLDLDNGYILQAGMRHRDPPRRRGCSRHGRIQDRKQRTKRKGASLQGRRVRQGHRHRQTKGRQEIGTHRHQDQLDWQHRYPNPNEQGRA